MTKGLIDEGVPGGFGAVAVYQEIRDCLGISEPTGVLLPQGTNAALCDVLVYWFFLWRKPPWETVFIVWVWGLEQLGAWPGSQVEAAALFWCFLSLWSGLWSPLCEMGA